MVGKVPEEFDRLLERLERGMPDRLQEEPTPQHARVLFGFPAQMARLKRRSPISSTTIFEPTRYQSNATLRGFYFTSGTQEGTPIDQLIGALARSFGAQRSRRATYSGTGKSFFLHRSDRRRSSSARPAGSRPTAPPCAAR